MIVLLLLGLIAGAVYVVLAAPGRAQGGRPTAGGAAPSTGVGAVAYGVTVGVFGLVASVILLLGGFWLLFIALVSPGLLIFGVTVLGQAVLAAGGLLFLAVGLLLAREARRRLLSL
ncbi:MAG: hypothetical protein WBU92_05195 [Candidatus Dormiibacterota bacterium]